jgi:dephospho-CoA kinase
MTDKPIILAFVGMPGSGKGTCVKYVTERYNAPEIYFGGMVYEEIARRGLDTVKDEKAVREDMRAQEGPAVLAIRVAQKAKEYLNQGKTRIVLDGVYSWSEDRYLNKTFGDAYITIAIAAPRELRHQRTLSRKDARRTYTLDDIKARDIAEIENLEKGGPIANANFTLLNDGDTSHLYKQLDKVLADIGF